MDQWKSLGITKQSTHKIFKTKLAVNLASRVITLVYIMLTEAKHSHTLNWSFCFQLSLWNPEAKTSGSMLFLSHKVTKVF